MVEQLPGNPPSWTHEVLETAPTWTRYLLTPAQLSALHQLTDLPEFHPLSEVARLTVSTVTGANEVGMAEGLAPDLRVNIGVPGRVMRPCAGRLHAA